MRFPKGTKAFWDDTHYIFYVDPNVRSMILSNILIYIWCAYDDRNGNAYDSALGHRSWTGPNMLKFLITCQLKGEMAVVAES